MAPAVIAASTDPVAANGHDPAPIVGHTQNVPTTPTAAPPSTNVRVTPCTFSTVGEQPEISCSSHAWADRRADSFEGLCRVATGGPGA